MKSRYVVLTINGRSGRLHRARFRKQRALVASLTAREAAGLRSLLAFIGRAVRR